MATPSSNPSKKPNTSPPPKRGLIKAQMFESLLETLVSAASKAKALVRITRQSGDSSGGSTTTTVSPPPSTYTSNGNSVP